MIGIDAALGIGVVLDIALKGILALNKLRIALPGVHTLCRADAGIVFQIVSWRIAGFRLRVLARAHAHSPGTSTCCARETAREAGSFRTG